MSGHRYWPRNLSIVPPTMFGADGTGAADSGPAFELMVNSLSGSGRYVKGVPGSKFKIATAITLSMSQTIPAIYDFRGCEIWFDSTGQISFGGAPVHILGGWWKSLAGHTASTMIDFNMGGEPAFVEDARLEGLSSGNKTWWSNGEQGNYLKCALRYITLNHSTFDIALSNCEFITGVTILGTGTIHQFANVGSFTDA